MRWQWRYCSHALSHRFVSLYSRLPLLFFVITLRSMTAVAKGLYASPLPMHMFRYMIFRSVYRSDYSDIPNVIIATENTSLVYDIHFTSTAIASVLAQCSGTYLTCITCNYDVLSIYFCLEWISYYLPSAFLNKWFVHYKTFILRIRYWLVYTCIGFMPLW